MIIRGSRELMARYHELCPGDVFIGTVVSRHLKHCVLIDLLERGIRCLPSPLSQNLNGSKAAQAWVFKDLMLPETRVITRRSDLVDAVNRYGNIGIGPVVSKENRMHCGHGVRRWDNIESLYNHLALLDSSYPFVLQPFVENLTDVRVIIVGDYMEAYARHNPDNFRQNLSSGAESRPFELTGDTERFCQQAMDRGKFPYAHIDLQIKETGQYYLSEIMLNGGITGAAVNRKDLDKKKKARLEALANTRQ